MNITRVLMFPVKIDVTANAASAATVGSATMRGSFGWIGHGCIRSMILPLETVVPFPPAADVYAGVDRGDGVVGTLHASNIAVAAGSGSSLSAAILKSGEVVDDVTGTLEGGGGASQGWAY